MNEKSPQSQEFSIYCIENKLNGLKYIGQTTKPAEIRWKQHKQWSNLGSSNSLVHKAIKEVGPENFNFEVINTTFNEEELDDLEREAVKSFKTIHPHGYNMTAGGLRGKRVRGFKHRESLKRFDVNQKISVEQLGVVVDLCRRKGIESIQIDGLSLKLTSEAPESTYQKKQKLQRLDKIKEPIGDPVKDAMDSLFWSTTGEINENQAG